MAIKTEEGIEPHDFFMTGLRALLRSLSPGTKDNRSQTSTHSAAAVDQTRNLKKIEKNGGQREM